MPLDTAALETLQLGNRSAPERYRDSPLRRRKWWVLGGLALLLGAALAYRAMNAAVPVRTAVVEAPGAGEAAVLNASGYVVARRLATVSSKVTGRIEEVLFEEGATVAAGQVLARLDATTERAEHEVARRSLEAARRSLREIEVRLADARRTQERVRSLRDRRLVAQSALDGADADVAALAARLEAARAEVAVAAGALALRQQALDDLAIRAPFAGVVISKDAQPGGGFTRTGIATLVDMDSREIEVDVNEAYINRVRDGQRVEAVLDAYPDWKIPGHVLSIVPTADRQKATVRVRIGFDRLDPRILPDMGIKVGFLEDPGAKAAAGQPQVAAAALVREGDASHVWVVRDGRVERREVQLGAESGGAFPVLRGLEGGESVVLDPPRRLRDGARVELEGA